MTAVKKRGKRFFLNIQSCFLPPNRSIALHPCPLTGSNFEGLASLSGSRCDFLLRYKSCPRTSSTASRLLSRLFQDISRSFLAPNPLLRFPWSLLPLTARVTLGKPATLFWGDPCEISGEGLPLPTSRGRAAEACVL